MQIMKLERFARGFLVLAALSILGASGASAAEAAKTSGVPDPSIATSLPRDLADPGGVRASLASRGITYGLNYIGDFFGVTSGGLRRGGKYVGRLEFTTDIDMEKLIGWRGLTFHANAYQIHGQSITGENVGSLAPVSFIEATPATRLFELWLEQSLIEGKVSVRFGQLAADSEFLTSEGGGAFINGTFGWPTITASNLPDGGPAYPLATPGVRIKVSPDERLTFLAGFFNGEVAHACSSDDPQICNRDGLEFPLGDPLFMMFEGQFKYSIGLPGTFKVGAWKHQGKFDDYRIDSTGGLIAITGGTPRVLDSDHGFYAVVDQTLWRVPGTEKGVAAFARVATSPSDQNLVSLYLDGGFTFSGIVPSRPDDVLGIGAAYTRISKSARGADGDRNVAAGIAAPKRDYEAMLEISYAAQIVPGFSIQPDFQYFWNPGGSGVDPDDDATGTPRPRSAAVIGVRTTINY